MPRRTPTSYAILGLLSVRPWTTYELAKQVQRSLNWFWPRAERKLYDEPKNLVADGLATASAESTGKRPRTVYEITDLGRDALARWLDEEPAPRSGEFEAMLKVFFGNAGTLDQLRTTLDRVAVEAQERLQALSGMAAGPVAFPERSHLNALSLRLYLEQEEAVLRWAVWARAQLGQWVSTTDPGTWDVQGELASQASRASEVVAQPS